MKAFETFFKNLLNDAKVDLTDEFDRNFERKAFFDRAWPQTKWPNNKGSLMMRTGAGRRSIKSSVQNTSIVFSSSMPYMALHNEGGEVTVTAKMKSFFWAMYYKANNALIYAVKTKGVKNTIRNRKLTDEAAIWKALALQKVGDKMKIPERRFIGPHPKVDESIQHAADDNIAQLEHDIFNELKKGIKK